MLWVAAAGPCPSRRLSQDRGDPAESCDGRAAPERTAGQRHTGGTAILRDQIRWVPTSPAYRNGSARAIPVNTPARRSLCARRAYQRRRIRTAGPKRVSAESLAASDPIERRPIAVHLVAGLADHEAGVRKPARRAARTSGVEPVPDVHCPCGVHAGFPKRVLEDRAVRLLDPHGGVRAAGRAGDADYDVVVCLRLVVQGLGLGLVMQVLVVAVQNAVDYTDLGVATSGTTLFARSAVRWARQCSAPCPPTG